MDYFSRKSLSKYLMNTIDFNKHDVDIFINGTWQKYAGLHFQLLPRQCKKWIGKEVVLRFSDFRCLGVSVFCNLIGWYFYHHVGFKKGRSGLWNYSSYMSVYNFTPSGFGLPLNFEDCLFLSYCHTNLKTISQAPVYKVII
jgi:hypothetical protein